VSRIRVVALAVACALLALPALPGGAAQGKVRAAKPPGRPSKVAHIVESTAEGIGRRLSAERSPRPLSTDVLHVRSDGRIELLFHSFGPIAPVQEAALERLGATISARLSPESLARVPAGMVQAWIAHDRIDEAAGLPWVTAVTPPSYGALDPHPANGAVSEGVALHNADDAQARGFNGNGVNVGVISDGVSNLATAQAANELPAVNVLDAGGGDEGTAMLEIVHDMAPGAGLLFDGTGGGVVNHVNSQNNLVANGAHMITEDIPFDAEPAFAQGLAAQNGDNIAAGGVAMHSSAGNLGGRHTARVAAVGTGGTPDGVVFGGTPAGCTYAPSNVVAIAPGGDTTFDLQLGQSNGNGTSFTLQWSEPRAIFPTAGQGGFTDVDLFVMNAALTQCFGESIAVQAGGLGDTIEQVVTGAGLAGTNAKIVVNVAGTSSAVAAPLIDLRWRRDGGAIDNTTRAGSLNPDSNYLGQATSEAAINGNSGNLEGFSAAGPVQIVTTTQCPGGAPGPCVGVAGPATQTANGPSWAGADGVQVSGAGGFGSACPAGTCFFGTSASTPHAAACDALLRDALNAPAANPATTNARLAATAVDIDTPGVDVNTGSGRLDCLAAVNEPPVADADGPYLTTEGVAVALDGTASDDPDIPLGDSLTFAWDLDNDSTFETAGATPSFTDVGQDGVFPVCLRVTDEVGVTDTDCSQVAVTNVEPSIGFGPVAPVDENSPITVTGTATDPGWEDPLSGTIDWGDGTPAEPLGGVLENVQPDATLAFSVGHTYGDDGTFTAEVCVEDDDNPPVSCDTVALQVDNLDPTADIDEAFSGAVNVNGTPTIIANAGDPVDFKGDSTDEGSDDLDLSWNFDDGTPVVTVTSLVNPPLTDPDPSPSIQPRSESAQQTHAFADACAFEPTFTAEDDDAGSAQDEVAVIITGNADERRGAGYWHHQYKGNGQTDFDQAELECYLEITGFMSTVFDESVDASTIQNAKTILFGGTAGSNMAKKLDRALLTAWLNFANGSIGLGTLVDTDGDGVPDTAFAAVLANAEAIRLNPGSTDAQLEAQKDLIERVNESLA